MQIKNTLPAMILLAATLFTTSAKAEQSQIFDQYTVHYNAMNTEMLNAEVARGYKIARSKNRAFLSISVLKEPTGTSFNPVKAKVTATSTNLISQLREIEIRELEDSGAIYYIGVIPIHNEETLDFDLKIQPEGSDQTYNLKFQQQFFTE